MLTIKLHIKSLSDSLFIENKQKSYSYAFRKLYRNIDKLDDKIYMDFIKSSFGLNDIEFRSVISEVKTKFSQVQSNKNDAEEKILDINKELASLRNKEKTRKVTRIIFKLERSLKRIEKGLGKDIVFGGKKNLIAISYLSNCEKTKDILKRLAEAKRKYKENRALPVFLIGEANQKGNRFFDFFLNENKIIYKPERGTKIEINLSCHRSYKNNLAKLQELIDKKEISVSVSLSESNICLSFNDEILSGYALDEKERTKEVSDIKKQKLSKETATCLIKEVYKKYYREREVRMISGKKWNRYLAIDTNPYHIGCSIIDKCRNEIKVVYTFDYDLVEASKKLDRNCTLEYRTHINNKRIHGISQLWKDVFEICDYYKCSYVVIEDLNLKGKSLETKEANRQTKTVWHRELSSRLITKHCNKNGIQKIEVNPCYSSFIGNIQYDYIDPINASIEIGRRGIFKYKKQNFYPKFSADTIMDAMSKLNPLRDVSFFKDCHNWVDAYKNAKKSELRYRATLTDTNRVPNVVCNLVHGNISKICFSSENFLSLPINS